METYKTFKSSGIENDVQQFINQYDDIMTLVVVNDKEYSIDFIDTIEETEEEFFFKYSQNESSKKAWELIKNKLNS